MSPWSRLWPYLVAAGAALYLLLAAVPPPESDGQMHVESFGRLPVQEGGRVKPLDTVARNSLMVISDRDHFYREDGGTESASQWLLDMMTGKAQEKKVVRIENDEVLTLLGLQERPGSFRYSWDEFKSKIPDIGVKAEEAQLRRKQGLPPDKVDDKLLTLAHHLELYLNLASLSDPGMVPPAHGDKWLPLRDALEQEESSGQPNRAADSLVTVLSAYAKNDTAGFNRSLAEYRRSLERDMPSTLRHIDFECTFFNHFSPFVQCLILYGLAFVLVVLGFVLACFFQVSRTEPLNRAAFWLLVVTLVVHSAALVGRMYLMDRWLVFVTNLYSSALYIGLACGLLGLILERIFRNGIGLLVASVAGLLTMVIAMNLGSGEDTLEMMRAVLDTNFWLATHVTCVTMGYSATFVAGLVGVVIVLYAVGCHLQKRPMDRELFVALGWMAYGVVCFATLLSFTGTVLGGIWADQSWGRFWGWDPKENGALLIVIWNAMILHARWAGLVKQRGTAVLAVGGNIVTAWSWFGVNMLGVGLHSYGFMKGAPFWLGSFMLSQGAIMLLGALPLGAWGNLTAPKPKLPPVSESPAPRLRQKSPHVMASR
jgi:ABC-type transport system involved in cytochrome c biogenesis permease subunit